MKQRRISEIFFEDCIDVPALRSDPVAVLQSLCERELRLALEGGQAALRALGGTDPGCSLAAATGVARVCGWVEQIGDDAVTFRVVARVGSAEVLDCSLAFALTCTTTPPPAVACALPGAECGANRSRHALDL